MPNTIKFNSSSIEEKSLRKGNIYIGVGDVGKGPTSLTGFKGGVNLGSNAYLISLHRGSGVFSHYLCSDDSDLISKTNKIDTSVVRTTKEECFSYFVGQSDKIILNKEYEPIVTDGLVLLYDSNFLPSYPATSSIWYNLGLLQQNASLENGPIFNSNGWIEFDGTNDFIKITSTSSISFQPNQNFSLFCIFNVKSINGTTNVIDNTGVIFGQGITTGSFGIGANYNQITNSYNFRIGVRTTSNTIISAEDNTLVLNVIYNVGFSYSPTSIKIYINGVLKNTISTTGISNSSFSSSDYHIYRNYAVPNGNGRWLNGNVYGCSIYNKSLSDQEVLQNYYQGPIVTDGLQFAVDARNIVSYDGLTSSVKNLSGTEIGYYGGTTNNATGNAPVFDPKGWWSFDGSSQQNISWGDNFDLTSTNISGFIWGWVNSASGQLPWIDKLSGQGNYRLHTSTTGQLIFGIRNTSNTYQQMVSGNGVVEFQRWNYIGFTYDNTTRTGKTYINGSLVQTNVFTIDRGNTLEQLRIGYQTNNGFNLNGRVSSVYLYNRELSISEILQNYNAHRSRFGI